MEEKFNLKNIFGNGAWQIAEKIITMIIGVIITAVVARYLGTENYGIVNYVISVVLLFSTFSTLGMETISVRDLTSNKEDKATIIGTSFIIRIIGGITLIILSQLTLGLLSNWNREFQILGIVMGISILFKSFEVIEYYVQSIMKLKITATIRMISAIIVAGYKLLAVCLDLGMIGFIFSYLLDAIIVGFLLYIWFRKENKEKLKFSKYYAKSILKQCWYLAFSGLMTTIYMRMDQVMLGTMMESKTENGIYSAAVRIAEMWYFVPTAIITSFQPMIMEAKKYSQKLFLDRQQQLYDIIAIIGVICIVGISIFGKLIVHILYGDKYLGAVPILLISIWSGLFATLGSARAPWLVSENLQKYTIVYITSGAVVNTILNFLLIPKYGGNGAAIATLIAQMFTSIITVLFIKKMRISGLMMLKSIFKNDILIKGIKKIRRKIC